MGNLCKSSPKQRTDLVIFVDRAHNMEEGGFIHLIYNEPGLEGQYLEVQFGDHSRVCWLDANPHDPNWHLEIVFEDIKLNQGHIKIIGMDSEHYTPDKWIGVGKIEANQLPNKIEDKFVRFTLDMKNSKQEDKGKIWFGLKFQISEVTKSNNKDD